MKLAYRIIYTLVVLLAVPLLVFQIWTVDNPSFWLKFSWAVFMFDGMIFCIKETWSE